MVNGPSLNTNLQAQAVIVGWQVYSITGDPFMLGLVGLVEAVPAIACALFAGHIVDISRPHYIFRCCIGALGTSSWAFMPPTASPACWARRSPGRPAPCR